MRRAGPPGRDFDFLNKITNEAAPLVAVFDGWAPRAPNQRSFITSKACVRVVQVFEPRRLHRALVNRRRKPHFMSGKSPDTISTNPHPSKTEAVTKLRVFVTEGLRPSAISCGSRRPILSFVTASNRDEWVSRFSDDPDEIEYQGWPAGQTNDSVTATGCDIGCGEYFDVCRHTPRSLRPIARKTELAHLSHW